MYRRNLETTKRLNGNENAAEEIASLKGNKQFGPSSANKSFSRSNSKESSALKLKSNNQKSDPFSKNTSEKQKLHIFHDKTTKSNERSTTIPLKRSESAIGQVQQSQSKKQDIRVERTFRHKEQEQEWTPQGLDLDFSAFDDTVQESSYHIKQQSLENDDDVDVESFPVIERQFNAKATIQVEEEEIAQPEVEHDTSTVEYCPPKEKEIPYEPDQSCIIDTCHFTSYVDMDAYEYTRLTGNHQEFILYQDPDVLKQDMVHPINDDALEFDYDSECADQDSELSNDLDFSNIPFSDHTFDVDQFIQCN
ncbi:Signal recognition particle [Mucor circinelloides]